jgi:murein DD-endopeptidase MepM/ murein hydrolase activator NlpD
MQHTHTHTTPPGRRRPSGRASIALAAAAVLSLVPIATPAASAAPASSPRRTCPSSASTYTVEPGDGWASAAASVNVSTTSLLRANDAKASAPIFPDDVLCLPPNATRRPASARACSASREVADGESWAAIANSIGTTLSAVLDANDATAATVLQPGDKVCLPPHTKPAVTANRCAGKRTVVAGDSWYVISRSTGVPFDALYAANDASSSSVLHPGQSVCLPEVGFGRDLQSMLLHVAPLRGACRFANSWMAPRGGRYHVGVDLISPTGTPVIAVVDGTLTRTTTNSPVSGNAWWLTASSGTYFFYAHMSWLAPGLTVGSRVHAGDVIGYVGSTGNAVSPHLHFEIHPYGGGPVNPYDSVWMLGGCRYDIRYAQTPLS